MNFLNDLVRRVEILALVMNGEILSKEDIAVLYNVAEITVNRDLKWLRQRGISIYSIKKKLSLSNRPDQPIINELMAEYLALKLSSDLLRDQILVQERLSTKHFFEFTTLFSKAVREHLCVTCKYKRFYDNQTIEYELQPVKITNSELNWMVSAYKKGEDILKTFYLSRFIEIKLTDKHFSLPKQPVIKKSNLHDIVLRFSPNVEEELTDKLWFEEFSIEKDAEGYILLQTKQLITNKLATWCISWWDSLQIIRPQKLKDFIVQMFADFIENNK